MALAGALALSSLIVFGCPIDIEERDYPEVSWSDTKPLQCPAGTTLASTEVDAYGGFSEWCERDGVAHGPWLSYYQDIDGTRYQVRSDRRDGKWHGIYKRINFDTKALQEQGNYRDNLIHGWWRLWHENGNLASESQYKNGTIHGFQRSFYEDGTMWLEQEFFEGALHGMKSTFHNNGRMASQGTYDMNVLTGESRQWHANGQLQWTGYYEDNALTGRYTEWDNAGRRLRDGRYKQGTEVGRWTYWNHETGEVTETDNDDRWTPRNWVGDGADLQRELWPE